MPWVGEVVHGLHHLDRAGQGGVEASTHRGDGAARQGHALLGRWCSKAHERTHGWDPSAVIAPQNAAELAARRRSRDRCIQPAGADPPGPDPRLGGPAQPGNEHVADEAWPLPGALALVK
jgi:hypothetical protein